MGIKGKVIAFLWIVTLGVFIGMATLDIVGDSILNWAHYLLLGTSIATMISSTAIWFFTDECHVCSRIVSRNDSYCKRCGADLIRKNVQTSYAMEMRTESPDEMPPLPESP